MNVSDYRKQYQKRLEDAATQQTSYRDFLDKSKSATERMRVIKSPAGLINEDELNQSVEIVRDKNEEVQIRASALHAISTEIGNSNELIDIVLSLLGARDEPPTLRIAALRVLQQISFSSALFRSKRPEFLATLRSVIDDENTELRHLALEILAIEKDEYVQRCLLDQLQGRSKALIGTSRAIQLLGYDIHAEHYPILREIVKTPPSRAAKKEAVRLLGADPSSKELLTEILRDKDEHREVRKISAVALQSLAPAEFEEQAKQIVLDEDEYDEIRATSINALNQFGSSDKLSQETELNEQIKALNATASSKHLKHATSRFISKHGA